MATFDEVKNEMVRSLTEWGINPRRDPEHERFFERAVRATLMNFQGRREDDDPGDSPRRRIESSSTSQGSPSDDDFSPEHFPEGTVEAIEYVLRSEIVDRRKGGRGGKTPPCITLDLLLRQPDGTWSNNAGPSNVKGNAPYFFNARRGEYQMPAAFARYEKRSLDPLRRFVTGDVSEEVFFYHAWFDLEVVNGLAFEAIVACHAIHRSSCVCCGGKSLTWSGGQGSAASWRDMECAECRSTYEVKSKKSAAHMDKEMRFNSIRGGSYYHFHKVRLAGESLRASADAKQPRRAAASCDDGWSEVTAHRHNKSRGAKRMAKHFLVLVSRSPSWHTGRSVWEVEHVEIAHVVPRLKDRSFSLRDGRSPLSIGTGIVTKVPSRKKWFKIPCVEFDLDEIAKRIYDELFPSGTRAELEGKWASGAIFEEIMISSTKKRDVPSNKHREEESKVAKERDSVESLKKELKKLSVGDGDWDDFASEEDFEKAWAF